MKGAVLHNHYIQKWPGETDDQIMNRMQESFRTAALTRTGYTDDAADTQAAVWAAIHKETLELISNKQNEASKIVCVAWNAPFDERAVRHAYERLEKDCFLDLQGVEVLDLLRAKFVDDIRNASPVGSPTFYCSLGNILAMLVAACPELVDEDLKDDSVVLHDARWDAKIVLMMLRLLMDHPEEVKEKLTKYFEKDITDLERQNLQQRPLKYLLGHVPCRHGGRSYYCKQCKDEGIGGGGICDHGVSSYYCKRCKKEGIGGAGICQHLVKGSKCKQCKGTCEHGLLSTRCLYCTSMQKVNVFITSKNLGITIDVMTRTKAPGSKIYRDDEIQPWAAPPDDYVILHQKKDNVCPEIKAAQIPRGARLSFINDIKVTSSAVLKTALRNRRPLSLVTIRFDFTPPSTKRTARWGE